MIKKLLSLAVLFLSSSTLAGVVNLNLSGQSTVNLNEEFNVSLIASGNNTMMATDVIIGWNVNEVQLIGISHQNSHPLILKFQSGLLYPDFYGINESAIPTDGTALYTGFVQLGNSISASNPFEIVSFKFKAINVSSNASIQIVPYLDINTPCETAVYGSSTAGVNVLGTTNGLNFNIVPAPSILAVGALFLIPANRRRRS